MTKLPKSLLPARGEEKKLSAIHEANFKTVSQRHNRLEGELVMGEPSLFYELNESNPQCDGVGSRFSGQNNPNGST